MRLQVQGQQPRRKALPAQLVGLLALALTLGAVSLSRLRGSPSALDLHQQDVVQKELPARQDQRPPQEETAEPSDPGACFKTYPWVEPALDSFYVHAWAAANATTQSTEESLAALRAVMWGKYHPGMDEVTLLHNPETGKIDMQIEEVSRPNQEHKKRCMLGLLSDAVAAHGPALAALLKGRPPLRLIVETEDFGVTWRGAKSKLPAFAMCTDNDHSDIPVPDFTWYCYPEARYRNSSWPAVQDLLQRRSDMVGWHERHPELFHRSNWAVGPRRGLMPLLQTYDNGTAGVSAMEAFGAELNIENTGFVQVDKGQAVRRHDAFVWLDGQCDYKYLIHTAGFSYSGGLKYKLACGSMVFKFSSPYQEFFEPALKDGVHVIALPAGKEGVDVEHFKAHTAPRIKAAVQRTRDLPDQPPVARQGQAFAREQLTVEALHCYWLGALQRYAGIYYSEGAAGQAAAAAADQAAAAQGGGGDAAGGGGG